MLHQGIGALALAGQPLPLLGLPIPVIYTLTPKQLPTGNVIPCVGCTVRVRRPGIGRACAWSFRYQVATRIIGALLSMGGARDMWKTLHFDQ